MSCFTTWTGFFPLFFFWASVPVCLYLYSPLETALHRPVPLSEAILPPSSLPSASLSSFSKLPPFSSRPQWVDLIERSPDLIISCSFRAHHRLNTQTRFQPFFARLSVTRLLPTTAVTCTWLLPASVPLQLFAWLQACLLPMWATIKIFEIPSELHLINSVSRRSKSRVYGHFKHQVNVISADLDF